VKWAKRGSTLKGLTMVVLETKSSLGPDLSKYEALIYRHVRAWTKNTSRGTTGNGGAICIVMISVAKCCSLYE